CEWAHGGLGGPNAQTVAATGGHAWVPGRDRARLHLDAPRLPELGAAVDRLHLARHRDDQLDGTGPAPLGNPRRARGRRHWHRNRLDHRAPRLERLPATVTGLPYIRPFQSFP